MSNAPTIVQAPLESAAIEGIRSSITRSGGHAAFSLDDLAKLVDAARRSGHDASDAPTRVVIPAAGKGSRFGAGSVKALARGDVGRELLLRVLDSVASFDGHPVVVVNDITGAAVKAVVASDGVHDPAWCTQTAQRGMGDAVRAARDTLMDSACDLLVIWSDIGAIDPRLIDRVGEIHRILRSPMTVATCWVSNPYVAIERDQLGNPCRVLQSHEGDLLPAEGETDCGFFWVRSPDVFGWIDALEERTPAGKEINFLPILESVAQSTDHPPVAVNVAADLRSYGVNTKEELVEADRAWHASNAGSKP